MHRKRKSPHGDFEIAVNHKGVAPTAFPSAFDQFFSNNTLHQSTFPHIHISVSQYPHGSLSLQHGLCLSSPLLSYQRSSNRAQLTRKIHKLFRLAIYLKTTISGEFTLVSSFSKCFCPDLMVINWSQNFLWRKYSS